MNKVILGLILAVCVLGMALVMLNERLGRKPEPRQAAVATQQINESPGYGTKVSGQPISSPDNPQFNNDSDNSSRAGQSAAPKAGLESSAKSFEIEEAEAALAPPNRLPSSGEDIASVQPKVDAPKIANRLERPIEQRPQKPEPVKSDSAKPKIEQPVKSTQSTQVEKAVGPERSITRFVIFSRDKGATIRIAGNSKLRYKSITLEDPDRVVLDMDGEWKFPSNPGIPKNDLVNNVRVGQSGDKTRVVIDLKEKPRSVRLLPAKNGDGVDVRIDK